ncbi:hypothetical protein CRUP_004842 [Coryphaenoides rupestris]|nr:hypothetical protein CRUP_004842 [Coryphaenoides rupestris]
MKKRYWVPGFREVISTLATEDRGSVRGYRVVYVPSEEGSSTELTLPSTHTSVRLVDLLPAVLYNISIFAVEEDLESLPVFLQVLTMGSAASESVTEITSNSFVISWTSAADTISGFRVEYELSEEGAETKRISDPGPQARDGVGGQLTRHNHLLPWSTGERCLLMRLVSAPSSLSSYSTLKPEMVSAAEVQEITKLLEVISVTDSDASITGGRATVQISCLLPWVRTQRWPSRYWVPASVTQVPSVGGAGWGRGRIFTWVTREVSRGILTGVHTWGTPCSVVLVQVCPMRYEPWADTLQHVGSALVRSLPSVPDDVGVSVLSTALVRHRATSSPAAVTGTLGMMEADWCVGYVRWPAADCPAEDTEAAFSARLKGPLHPAGRGTERARFQKMSSRAPWELMGPSRAPPRVHHPRPRPKGTRPECTTPGPAPRARPECTTPVNPNPAPRAPPRVHHPRPCPKGPSPGPAPVGPGRNFSIKKRLNEGNSVQC